MFLNVPFTSESGHVRRNWGCPLWAKSGHWTLFDYFIGGDNQAGGRGQP
jgi:hypothetical protein